MIDAVGFVAEFESFNLADNVGSVVGDAHKATANALLIVRVLDPAHEFASTDANLLKVFHFDLFFN